MYFWLRLNSDKLMNQCQQLHTQPHLLVHTNDCFSPSFPTFQCFKGQSSFYFQGKVKKKQETGGFAIIRI